MTRRRIPRPRLRCPVCDGAPERAHKRPGAAQGHYHPPRSAASR